MRFLIGLFLLALPVLAETVRFKTSDGVEIVADWHPSETEDASTVICIPMFRSTRAAYAPLVKPLLWKGMNVLAIDTRGHGESAPGLRAAVVGRKPEVFAAMHEDVAAAIGWLEAKGLDPTRVGLVGASVGCSVAVDATVRQQGNVRAVVLLTPGAKYLGMPTLEHIKKWRGTRVVTYCSSQERATSQPVIHALDEHGDDTGFEIFDEKKIHGTRMFGRVQGIERRIADFMERSLVKSVSLNIPKWKGDDPALRKPGFFRQVLGPRRKVGEGVATMMAWVVDDEMHLGVLVDQPFAGSLRFVVGSRTLSFPFDTAQRSGNVVESGGVKATQGAAGGKFWLEFTTEAFELSGPVAVELRPRKGKQVRLPSGKHPYTVVVDYR